MLYRTHPTLFSSHSALLLPYLPPTIPIPHLISSSSPSIQVQEGMDCVKMALKSSFSPEMVLKPSSQHTFLEDLATVSAQTAAVSSDDLFVDDFLDFSKADTEDGFVEEEDNKVVSLQELNENDEFNPTRSNFSVPESELCVPADDLADLEWVSHFVDDSFSGYALTYPAGKIPEKPLENLPEPEIPVLTKPCLTTPIQTKARSKRARTGGRVWSLGSPSLTDSSATSSSASSSCTTSSPPPLNPWLIYNDGSLTAESLMGQQPQAKKKKKPAAHSGGGVAPQPRRCSHCLVQKTPQWRTGPLGAKTLCNACGVRYKSGRLLPEYRPACSPTFLSEVHSNNHRKVLEMRRKKEVETGDGLAQPVQSF